jgi:eukaryotic-like serine/threonine-protein kinase
MNLEKWARVKQIFNAALDVSEAERADFVQSSCADDETLLFEVKSLLEAEKSAREFIEAPAFAAVSELVEDTKNPSRVGQIVGAYKLKREIGRGGMGAVYLAERADEQFRKQVAVKLIKRGFDTDEIVRRFRYERQILASLDHPNITRLIDGGAAPDGTPFLVMDYVEGRPLTKYADERRLSIEERLRLFLQICAAVQYAHQNLIIHRDLKPSNILVTPEGAPKLLDFGIAKLLNAGGALTLEKSLTAAQAMTPEYASPEQITGRPVTTASDIYSLGVVLYELLTGYRPIRLTSRSQQELSKIITDTSPPKPSEAASLRRRDADAQRGGENDLTDEADAVPAASLRLPFSLAQLKGDLDNIVLMAMRKEPERRYSSVEQFAGDIRRYLDKMPVLAREDSFAYRASKFVARNKAGVAAGAGIALSLIAGIAATLRQSRIARQERDHALREAEKADKINKFLQKMLNSADPRVAGKDVKVIQVLELAAQSLDKDLSDQPEIAADLQTTIGLTYLSIGLYDRAEPHLRRALATRRRLFGEESRETALSLNNFGRLLQAKGEFSKAEPLYRRAVEILRRRRRRRAGSAAEAELELASVLHNYGYVLLLRGENARGIRLHREELEIRQTHLGENHPETAQTLDKLGNAFRLLGDLKTAETFHRRALEIFRRFYGDEHPDVAKSLVSLVGVVYHFETVEAERLCQEALRIQRKLLGEGHSDVAWTLYNFAYLSIQKGDAEKARQYAGEVLRLRGVSLDDEHPVIGSALLVLGRALMSRGRLPEAEKVLRESFELRRRTLPPDHWLVATAKVILGECLGLRGDREIAAGFLKEGYETLAAKLGDRHDQTQMAREKLESFQVKK